MVNIFSGCDEQFRPKHFSDAERERVRARFGVGGPFILYTGGVDQNKNLISLIRALSLLPGRIKQRYRLVCVGKRGIGEVERIMAMADDAESERMIINVGYVSEDELIDLYNACNLFVFPSLREGFGLPALEAMACGAPTIVSDRTSLPEVVDNPDALFDPTKPKSIAAKITQVLTDERLREQLAQRGARRAATLTWDRPADRALAALRSVAKPPLKGNRRARVVKSEIFAPNRKSILVQKLDHHGDFLLGVPAMAKLRARYPDARIDALVGPWNVEAARATGLFDAVHTLSYFKARSAERAQADREAIAALRDLPFYDYAIDLRRQPDTRFILFNIKAAGYYGYKIGDPDIDNLLTVGLDIHPEFRAERNYFDETHTSEQLLHIVDALPFDVNDYLTLPSMGERAPQLPGSVALFPRVGLDARQWDSERFAELAARLAATEAVSAINIYAMTPEELDPIPFAAHPKLHLRCGLGFAELSTSLSGNVVCIGNNSFGVHLASYVGCRTIGIYSGHELPQQWGPAFNDAQVVVVDAACAPCHLPDRKSCPFDVFCLDDIPVATVLELALAKLESNATIETAPDVQRLNPASAIKSLVDDLNKLSFTGKTSKLADGKKLAVAAAIAANFPEREDEGHAIYLDVSAFAGFNPGSDLSPARELQAARSLAHGLSDAAGRHYRVVEVATLLHGNEFFAISGEPRHARAVRHREDVVRPLAGDVFIGAGGYQHYATRQWLLLQSWRQLGVTIGFLVSDDILALADEERLANDDEAKLAREFLTRAAGFDVLVAEQPTSVQLLSKWAEKHQPPRLRPLRIGALPSADGASIKAANGVAPAAPSLVELFLGKAGPTPPVGPRDRSAALATL